MKSLIKYRDEEKENPLIRRPDLMEEAFNHFSRMSFNEASLSEMLRNVGMNKGSFYFKFYDKMDLYLCMIECKGKEKLAFLSECLNDLHEPVDFFSQLSKIITSTLEYTQKEPRHNSFWRIFYNETADIKKTVKTAFPEFNRDFLGNLIDTAIQSGQLNIDYNREFIYSVVNLYINNMDTFITPSMSITEIKEQVDKVIGVLKNSIGNQ